MLLLLWPCCCGCCEDGTLWPVGREWRDGENRAWRGCHGAYGSEFPEIWAVPELPLLLLKGLGLGPLLLGLLGMLDMRQVLLVLLLWW